MRHALLLATLLAGCGRLNPDALRPEADGAPLGAPAPDALPASPGLDGGPASALDAAQAPADMALRQDLAPACGAAYGPCCAGGACGAALLACETGAGDPYCAPYGHFGQTCLSNGTCVDGTACGAERKNICGRCGSYAEPCCIAPTGIVGPWCATPGGPVACPASGTCGF